MQLNTMTEIQRHHDLLRQSEDNNLSLEKRQELLAEANKLKEHIDGIVIIKTNEVTKKMEDEGIISQEDEVQEVAVKTKKNVLIKDQVSNIEDAVYDFINSQTDNIKVKVSLTNKLLQKYRQEKQTDEVPENDSN